MTLFLVREYAFDMMAKSGLVIVMEVWSSKLKCGYVRLGEDRLLSSPIRRVFPGLDPTAAGSFRGLVFD